MPVRQIILACAVMLIATRVLSNDYVIENNTQFPQSVSFAYSAPIAQGPVKISIAPHSKYSDSFNAAGYSATVLIAPGAYKIYHDGQVWNGPIVFGTGSMASSPGTYSLNIPPVQGSPPPQHPQAPPQQHSNAGASMPQSLTGDNPLLPNIPTDNSIKLKEFCTFYPPHETDMYVPSYAIGTDSAVAIGNRFIHGPPYYITVNGQTRVNPNGYQEFYCLRTTNNGASWTITTNSSIRLNLISNGSAFIAEGTNTYLSLDGESWSCIFSNRLNLICWHGSNLVASCENQLIWSQDMGATWNSQPLPDFFFYFPNTPVLISGDEDILVASVPENRFELPRNAPNIPPSYETCNCCVISRDLGKTWARTDIDSEMSGPPALFDARDGVIAHVDNNTERYSSLSKTYYIHESWDKGISWEVEPFLFGITPGGNRLAVKDGYIFIFHGNLIYAKRRGENWHCVEAGIDFDNNYNDLPKNKNIILAGNLIGLKTNYITLYEIEH